MPGPPFNPRVFSEEVLEKLNAMEELTGDNAEPQHSERRRQSSKGDMSTTGLRGGSGDEEERERQKAIADMMIDLGNIRAETLRTADKFRARPVDAAALAAVRSSLKQDDGWKNPNKDAALAIWGNMKEEEASDDDGTAGQAHRADLNMRLHGIRNVADIAQIEVRRDNQAPRGGRAGQGGRGGAFIGSRSGRRKIAVDDDGTFTVSTRAARGAANANSGKRAGRLSGPVIPSTQPRHTTFVTFIPEDDEEEEPPRPRNPPPTRSRNIARATAPPRAPPRPAPIFNLMSNDDFMAKIAKEKAEKDKAKAAGARTKSTHTTPVTIENESAEKEAREEILIKKEPPEASTRATNTHTVMSGAVKKEPIEESQNEAINNQLTTIPNSPVSEVASQGIAVRKEPKTSTLSGRVITEGSNNSIVQPPAVMKAQREIDVFSSITNRPRSLSVIGKELHHTEFCLKMLEQTSQDDEVQAQEAYAREKIVDLKSELAESMRVNTSWATNDGVYSHNWPTINGRNQSEVERPITAVKQTAQKDSQHLNENDTAQRRTEDLLVWSPERQSNATVTAKDNDDHRAPLAVKSGNVPVQQGALQDSMFAPKQQSQLFQDLSVQDQPVQPHSPLVSRGRSYSRDEMLQLRDNRSFQRSMSTVRDPTEYINPNDLPYTPLSAFKIAKLNAAKSASKNSGDAVKKSQKSSGFAVTPIIHEASIEDLEVIPKVKDTSPLVDTKSSPPGKKAGIPGQIPPHLVGMPASKFPAHLRHLAPIYEAESEAEDTKENIQPVSWASGLETSKPSPRELKRHLDESPENIDLTATTRPMEQFPKRNSDILLEEMGSLSFTANVEQAPVSAVESKPQTRRQAIPIIRPPAGFEYKASQPAGLAASAYSKDAQKENRLPPKPAGLGGSAFASSDESRREREIAAPVGYLFQGYNKKRDEKKPHKIPDWLSQDTHDLPRQSSTGSPTKEESCVSERDVSHGRKKTKNPFNF